jgi:hypothetical protein
MFSYQDAPDLSHPIPRYMSREKEDITFYKNIITMDYYYSIKNIFTRIEDSVVHYANW